MKRFGIISALVLAAAIAPAGAQAASLRLTPASAKFPDRAYVLTLPAGATIGAEDLAVTENGRTVDGLTVDAATSRFAVILAIDTSPSMRGRPIAGAMAAARAFAAQRPVSQPLGVVLFNGSSHVLLRPTTDAAAIDQALARTPALEPQTHIYDGAATALGLLKGHLDAGAVVVLSDGHDHGSTTAPNALANMAAARHARIFSVGLRSPLFDPSTLRDVAARSHGEYLGAASAGGLKQVYERLGGELSSAYRLHWRSLATSGSSVHVVVSTDTGEASAGYKAPSLSGVDSGTAPASDKRSFTDTTAFALLAGLVAAALPLLLAVFLLRRREERLAVRRRIAGYAVKGADVYVPDEEEIVAARDHREPGHRRKALELALELATIDMSPEAFVGIVAAISVFAAIVFGVLLGVFVGLFVLVAVPLGARFYVRHRVRQRRNRFADQLADTVQAVASAMRTGHSFVSGLSQVIESSSEPMASELRRVVADERLGVPLEDAIEVAVARMDNHDLRQVGLVSVLQRETGGNGAEALDRVVENLRGRDEVRRLVRTLSSQGRLSGRILLGLPVACVVLISIINPEQMHPLYHSFVGHVALVVAGTMMLLATAWIRKIVDIRV